MKKGVFFVLAALFSTQLIADDISGGPRINIQSGLLTIPCVKVDDPEGAFDQRSFDVRLRQSGDSFELIFAEEEDPEVCETLIEASLMADEDTSDVDGNNGNTNTDTIYKLGDRGPGGGIVFHLTDGGMHGLEAAPLDQGEATWGCMGLYIGASGTAVGTGHANTLKILAGCPPPPRIAATLAVDYKTLEKPYDWYLPSKDELNLLYIQKDVVGGFAIDYYWSSSEYNEEIAWTQYFRGGQQSINVVKDNTTFRVRAIRTF